MRQTKRPKVAPTPVVIGGTPTRVGGTYEAWAGSGKWAQAGSSNVAGIAYTLNDNALFVEFKDGSIYRYEHVSVQEARDFFHATSLGKYVAQKLRGKSYSKVHAELAPPRDGKG